MRKNVFLPNGNNKSTFQPEGAAPAASSLKSSYIKNEEKLSKERGTLNYMHIFNVLKFSPILLQDFRLPPYCSIDSSKNTVMVFANFRYNHNKIQLLFC